MLWFPILVISPPKALRKFDVIPLKKRGCFIKIFLHAYMFRVKTLPTVRTPDSFFPIVPFSFLPWTGRFIMLLIFKSRLWSIKFSFLFFLTHINSNRGPSPWGQVDYGLSHFNKLCCPYQWHSIKVIQRFLGYQTGLSLISLAFHFNYWRAQPTYCRCKGTWTH